MQKSRSFDDDDAFEAVAGGQGGEDGVAVGKRGQNLITWRRLRKNITAGGGPPPERV